LKKKLLLVTDPKRGFLAEICKLKGVVSFKQRKKLLKGALGVY